MGRLDELDLSKTLSRKEEERAWSARWERLAQLRLTLGGLIGERRVGPAALRGVRGLGRVAERAARSSGSSAPLDPRHVRVVQFAAPTSDEKRHHFLWRFCPTLPGWGGMAVFDRSWYGRVLVERVEELRHAASSGCAPTTRSTASSARSSDEGMILVKFWLHISAEEQLRRFERRASDPLKTWKLTDEDWRNRDKREALQRGGGGHARPDRPAERAVGAGRGRLEALRAGQGRRDGSSSESRTGMRKWGMEPPQTPGMRARLPLEWSAPLRTSGYSRGVRTVRAARATAQRIDARYN